MANQTLTLTINTSLPAVGSVSVVWAGTYTMVVGGDVPVAGGTPATATTTPAAIDPGALTDASVLVIANLDATNDLLVGYTTGSGHVVNPETVLPGAAAVLYPSTTTVYVEASASTVGYQYIMYPAASV